MPFVRENLGVLLCHVDTQKKLCREFQIRMQSREDMEILHFVGFDYKLHSSFLILRVLGMLGTYLVERGRVGT